MERPKVDARDGNFGIEIPSVFSGVERVGYPLDIEAALAAPCHEVVGVDALDVGAHFGDPGCEDVRGAAVVAAREVAGEVGAATGFVGELPAEDDGGVFVAGDEFFKVALERGFDAREGVELEKGWLVEGGGERGGGGR